MLSSECSLLRLLGQRVPYETAIGLNGRIWVKGRSIDETLVICNIIKNGELISEDKIDQYLNKAAKLAGVKR